MLRYAIELLCHATCGETIPLLVSSYSLLLIRNLPCRDIPEGFKGPSEDHPFRDIRGALASLIKDRLVERVPPASLPPSKVDPHDNVKSRRSTKSPFEHVSNTSSFYHELLL